jgi:predicted nucleotidyltransferase
MTAEIEQIRDVIVQEYHPDQIILLGSRARGDARPDSDIDILVVSDREKDLPRHRRGIRCAAEIVENRHPFGHPLLHAQRP